jgi:hypothetical protein
MNEPHVSPYVDDLPELDPVIAHEQTPYGWRGLTENGEVLEVKTNGHFTGVPSSITVARGGIAIGKRSVSNHDGIDIDEYLLHFNRVMDLYKTNRISEALEESDLTLRVAPTLTARFGRSFLLLAAGLWKEGFTEYWRAEQHNLFMRPQVKAALAAGLKPWMGEELEGRRLLLLHSHGFGDTIMCLRYVGGLGNSVMVMPPELMALARQVGLTTPNLVDADFFCPIFHLPYMRGIFTPDMVSGEKYLEPNEDLAHRWELRLSSRKKKIGLAWSVGYPNKDDYPREIDIRQLVDLLDTDAELHSVQRQDVEQANACGVNTHDFKDFEDCAALMCCMDEIISVDTAALHLAGAIGHSTVYGLLSNWASWRWTARWYDNVELLRQTKTNDWASALAQR